MSSIRDALERLDYAVSRLEDTAEDAEAAYSSYEGDDSSNIDADYLAARLDRAIACVETLLSEGA